MFFATLERLYELNISDAAMDLILSNNPESNMPMSFVYACPVCTPVYDAMSLYRKRPVLWGKKGLRQFSDDPGDWDRLFALKDPKKRTQALGAFVKESLSRKLDSMNLSAQERKRWDELTVGAHDEGGRLLKEYKKSGTFSTPAWMEKCEVCEGAEEAVEK